MSDKKDGPNPLNVDRLMVQLTDEAAAALIRKINALPMRVLVCGGRDYTDAETVSRALSELHRGRGIGLVIAGGARGADTLGADWAKAEGIPCEVFMADWEGLGRKAGPIRNRRMLDEGRPDLVVAFPGGRGTADMVRRAKAAGIEVVQIAAD